MSDTRAEPSAKRRLAVVLFNLGGPDTLKAVRPFLFNLFSDRAIIDLPNPIRWAVASLISTLRTKSASANYASMGGASPLLAETRKQADALQAVLSATDAATDSRVFMAMRYWTPSTEETAKAVERFAPDEVVLLPLYPQFSTTTTASSMKAWTRAYRGRAQVRTVCCYPELDALAEAHAQRIRQVWEAAGSPAPIRLLFSAHGLPQTVVDGGDPYQVQVEATAAAVLRKLGGSWDWRVCYQSRVGPMKWLGPYTLEALEEAGREGLGVLVSPIAFVSEHIETLVELDRDYAEAAKESGCPIYLRAPALGLQREFIEGLAVLVGKARSTSCAVASGDGWRCSGALGCCPRTLETAR